MFTEDLAEAKSQLNDAHRRIHEQEIEIKRLENEREELAAAYKEAETLRRQEEAKNQRLTAELAQVRHDYEKRLAQKEEEIEALRYVTRNFGHCALYSDLIDICLYLQKAVPD